MIVGCRRHPLLPHNDDLPQVAGDTPCLPGLFMAGVFSGSLRLHHLLLLLHLLLINFLHLLHHLLLPLQMVWSQDHNHRIIIKMKMKMKIRTKIIPARSAAVWTLWPQSVWGTFCRRTLAPRWGKAGRCKKQWAAMEVGNEKMNNDQALVTKLMALGFGCVGYALTFVIRVMPSMLEVNQQIKTIFLFMLFHPTKASNPDDNISLSPFIRKETFIQSNIRWS